MRKKLGQWKKLSGSVFENQNGTRIHTLGSVRIGDRYFTEFGCLPDYYEFYLREGRNRKRALMAWANNIETRISELNKQQGAEV